MSAGFSASERKDVPWHEPYKEALRDHYDEELIHFFLQEKPHRDMRWFTSSMDKMVASVTQADSEEEKEEVRKAFINYLKRAKSEIENNQQNNS